MVSHLEFRLPNKPPTPNNICAALGGPQRQLWKEPLFVKYDKNKKSSLISALIQIKSFPEGKNSSVHSFLLVLSKVTFMMHVNLLHITVKMGFIKLKVFILINHTVQWHMLTH